MWRVVSLGIFVACGGGTPSPASRTPTSVNEPTRTPAEQPATNEPATTTTTTTGSAPAYIQAGLLDGEAALDDGWQRWRAGTSSTFDAVFEIAVLANRARPLPTADELMVTALTRAVGLSECDPARLGKIRLLAIAVRGADHPSKLDADLAQLSDLGPAECQRSKRTR